MSSQSGILLPLPPRGRFLQFKAPLEGDLRSALRNLAEEEWDEGAVFGLGPSACAALESPISGLSKFPSFAEAKVDVPATPAAAWCFLRGEDPGELLQRGRKLAELLAPGLYVSESFDSFKYREGRDLTGYLDGTENPKPELAPEVALLSGQGAGLDGGAFVSVQRWVHDLSYFASWPQQQQDHAIGRRLSDNEELDDAPITAHVKRTAQESFSPEAFMLRRSMPYTCGEDEGLMFVSFARSLQPFEDQLRRMVGAEDGQVDALFRFSVPVSGANFFCPPMSKGRLDLSALL